MGKYSSEADTVICPAADAQALLKLIKREKLCRPQNVILFYLSEGQRVIMYSNLLKTVAAHPDLGCGYLMFWTL